MDDELDTAYSAYTDGDFETAFGKFLAAAERGDTHAMLQVGVMYSCGEGTSCDFLRALEWEKRADAAGNSSAAINIGITYRMTGQLRQAATWFRKALDGGDAEAALELAKLFIVSELELPRVQSYLEQALSMGGLCEASIEEANRLVSEIDQTHTKS